MRTHPILGTVLVLVGFAGFACGSSGSDSLLGGAYSPSGAASGSTGGPSGSSATGSTSTNPGSSGGATTSSSGGSSTGSSSSTSTGTGSADGGEMLDGAVVVGEGGTGPRALFEALLPGFNTTCGGACHQMGGTGAPPYLGGADPYTTIKTYSGMIAATAAQSILLTKGQHEGPPLADPLKTSLTGWLTAEAASFVQTGPAMTSPLAVASGANKIDLSSVGVAGASLGFSAAISGDILTLSALQLTAPAATGVTVTFPAAYVNANGTQTEHDDLSNVSQTVPAGTSATLGTGLLVMTGWTATATLQFSFGKLAAASASDAGLSGGCKNVASFTTNAVPAIQNNTCLNCHNTGGSGNASLDLSGLASNPVDDVKACAQALSRVNTTTPAQSDIILAPTGQVANHPFKTANANYTTMMETWISAEK